MVHPHSLIGLIVIHWVYIMIVIFLVRAMVTPVCCLDANFMGGSRGCLGRGAVGPDPPPGKTSCYMYPYKNMVLTPRVQLRL